MGRTRGWVAIAAALIACALAGWWWQDTADDRALREIVEILYTECLVDAATAPTPAESELIMQRCDRLHDQAGMR
jgi:hypothetical protein